MHLNFTTFDKMNTTVRCLADSPIVNGHNDYNDNNDRDDNYCDDLWHGCLKVCNIKFYS